MNRKHLALSIAMVGGLGLAAVMPAVTLAASPTTTGTPATPSDLIASSTPKTVVLDPLTGSVVSVAAGEPADISTSALVTAGPAVSGGTNCAAGDGCYYTPTVNDTYHDRSFYGSAGTFTGNWPNRNAWDSGSYTAYACWESACSGWVGPNTYVTFGGSLVTGTSFTIN